MWNIQEHPEVTSTNVLAKEQLLVGEAHHGDVIQTWHQTAGRGRFADRTWQDEPSHSLLMTIVLEDVPFSLSLLQYFSALSVVTALRKLVLNRAYKHRTKFRLKWPNDILLNDKKVSGILSEAIWQAQHLRGMIVGIGVNIMQDTFKDTLRDSAISLKQGGIATTVNEVRDNILSTFDRGLRHLSEIGRDKSDNILIGQVRKELAWMPSRGLFNIVINEKSVLHNMQYEGISEHGALLLRHEDGTVETIHAGSLEWSEHTTKRVGDPQTN
ncbi:MAG TPA: biotin--[acetyl-CoA-carboxylase] ligase [Candidatus Kapabacteria bacterium]|jgi:BirA family biotin operon repressor/biotin-[acetyl-CoA-carboxylase] ligase|nr:biotin--[acetyl-CoA-carboxylase] ligase [Candidatus Kapabacteria bacterium]